MVRSDYFVDMKDGKFGLVEPSILLFQNSEHDAQSFTEFLSTSLGVCPDRSLPCLSQSQVNSLVGTLRRR